MLDLQKFIAGLHDYIGKALQPLVSRIEDVARQAKEMDELTWKRIDDAERSIHVAFHRKLEELPKPQRGERGDDGKSVSVDDVLPTLQAELRKAIKEIPAPLKGDRGEPGPPGESVKGERGEDGKSVTVEDVLPTLKAELDNAIKAIAIPKDGKDGVDGKSVSADDVLPVLKAELQKAIDAIPAPKDGRDGKDGENGIDGVDGKSVTVEDLRGMFQAEQAKWALDFERRAQDILQRCVDNAPIPKDGRDGVDGLGFEDMEVIHDGERVFTFRFARGERVKEFAFKVPSILERGIYRSGSRYEKGDGVTYNGSYWIAQTDTGEKPGEGNSDWRLAVKRGRDGKDGVKGERGEAGRNGRDAQVPGFGARSI